MSGLGKIFSFVAAGLFVVALIALAPSLACAKPGGGMGGATGKGGGMGGSMGKNSGTGSWGGMSGSKGKTGGTGSWSGTGSSSGKSTWGGSSSSSGTSGKMSNHTDHAHHDHDYAHDHDHGYYHHHYYYGGYPVIIGGDVVSGDYIAADTCVDTGIATPQPYTPVATPQFYTVYFKDKSGNAQTYGRFDASAEGDRLAETQDRLTAAGVAWWTVDPNGVQVDTDIDQ
jgi:hypothetical protein